MQVCFLSCCNIPSRKHCETLCQVAQLKKTKKKSATKYWQQNKQKSLVSVGDAAGPPSCFGFILLSEIFHPRSRRLKGEKMFTEFPPTKKQKKQPVYVSLCLCAFGAMDQMTYICFLFFRFVYECSIHWIYWEHVFFVFVFLWIICWDGGGLGWFIRFDSYF